MAFPGCVIFLPPIAAAARLLLAAYDRWCTGTAPRPAAGRWDGGCRSGAELWHPLLTPQLSQGPSHTENGLSSEDIFLSRFYDGPTQTISDNNSSSSMGKA